MSNKSDTKSEIVKIAIDLIEKHSYNSISYQDISNILNIRKASIHYHFPSKADLGLVTLKTFRKNIINLISKLDERTNDPKEKLLAYFKFFKSIAKSNDRMCLAGVLSAEYNTLPKNMQEELYSFFNNYFTWLAKVLSEGKEKKQFNFNGTPEDMVLLIESSLHGSLLLSRPLNNKDSFDIILSQIETDLFV